ncbi:hypothetical protein ACLOJK_008930 [Asimina triloba]
MAARDHSPPLKILGTIASHIRESEGFSLCPGPPFINGQLSIKHERVSCTSVKFSENGSRLMVMKSDSTISICDCQTSAEIRSFELPAVLAATLSPCGTYLQTFQKPTTPQEKNLVLWEAQTGTAVYQQFQKNMSQNNWPSIWFSSNEAVACRLQTNEVQIFNGRDFSEGIIHKLKIPGIAAVELSKEPGLYVAAFIAESKGIPASIQIFACDKDSQGQPVARRGFFRCSTVQLHWNRGATGLLAVAQSDVDKTNQSYYGESKLGYLTTDGKFEGLDLTVEYACSKHQAGTFIRMAKLVQGMQELCLQKQRSSTGSAIHCLNLEQELCALGSKAMLSLTNCMKGGAIEKDKSSLKELNLGSQIAFWDYSEKKLLGTAKAEWSVTSEWSPNGYYFMTASTAPRRQIDNGLNIFHHNGSLYFKKMFNTLYQAEWKPEDPSSFGDISELVNSIETLNVNDNAQVQALRCSQASTKTSSVPAQKPATSPAQKPAAAPVQKPAAYRPPHAKHSAAIQTELFGGSGPSEEMSKNALRNKKKREKQKEKKTAEASSAANGIGTVSDRYKAKASERIKGARMALMVDGRCAICGPN